MPGSDEEIKYKTSKAQREANKRYQQKNKDQKNYSSKKTTTKNFLLKTATDEDVIVVEQWVAERKMKGKQT